MAEAPTPEEVQEKRDQLAELRKNNANLRKEKEGEAAKERLALEAQRLDREIDFELQAQAILEGSTPPDTSTQVPSNTPPSNSFPSTPAFDAPSSHLHGANDTDDDHENEEG